jgi:hypothetical protein
MRLIASPTGNNGTRHKEHEMSATQGATMNASTAGTVGLSDVRADSLYTLQEVQTILGLKYDALYRRLKVAGIVGVKVGGMGYPRFWGSQILELVGKKIIEKPAEIETTSERKARADAALERIRGK